jgi:hypothetical protein
MIKVQRIIVPDTRERSWVLFDGGQEESRVRIMRSRRATSHRVAPSASAAQDRERLSRQNIVATLRLRIKTLEERNSELTELLERAYGVIAEP